MKTLLLYNPKSGRENFHRKLNKIKKRFSKENKSLDIYASKGPKDLIQVAYKNAPNYDNYIVAGGDGTINEVINGIMKVPKENRPVLSLFPQGTVNDISKILKIPRSVNKNLNLFFNGKPEYIDINKINDKYFLYVCAAGYLTGVSYETNENAKKILGSLAYVRWMLKKAKIKPEITFNIKTKENKEITARAGLILVLAANEFGGQNLYNYDKTTKLNDGIIELRLFLKPHKRFLGRMIDFILSRGRKRKDQIHLSSSKFIIKTDRKDLKWNVDGEYGTSGNCEIMVFQKSLKIYIGPRSKAKWL